MKAHTNWINKIRPRVTRSIVHSLPLGSKPRCLVCQLTMHRNNGNQILKYHTECRQHKNILSRETRAKTP